MSDSLDELLFESLKKHFTKAKTNPQQDTSKTQTTMVDQSQSSVIAPTSNKQLQNVLNYQRSIIVQTSILRHNIGPSFYDKIDRGDIHELHLDAVESFLSACPKENEVEALQAAVQKHGIFDLQEA